ncbi:hypothetical protein EIG99_13490, partial [Staphylococcus condimenti]
HIDEYRDIAQDIHQNEDEECRTVTDIKNYQSTNTDRQPTNETQLDYQYPYQKDVVKPTKQSVSERKRQLETVETGTSYERVLQYQLGSSTY